MYRQGSDYKLFTGYERDEKVNMYVFEDVDVEISDYPNIARLQGVVYNWFADRAWMSYWKGFMAKGITLYDRGEIEEVSYEERVIKCRFKGDKITGVWTFVMGENKKVLLWKNPKDNEEVVCACVAGTCDSEGECINDKFTTVASIVGNDKFSGTAMAAGVFQGWAGKPTLFSNAFIEKMVDKYRGRAGDIKVDWNHDRDYKGELSEVKLETEPVHRFVVKGKAGDEVPDGAALSVDYDVKLEWNDSFKVYEAKDADIKAVTVAPGMTPGCKMCFVE